MIYSSWWGSWGLVLWGGRASAAPKRSDKWDVTQVVCVGKEAAGSDVVDGDVDLLDYDSFCEGLPHDRSHVIHICPSICSIVEGKGLVSTTKLPPTHQRLLTQVDDLNLGISHHCNGGEELDLNTLVVGQNHPLLLVHWVLVEQ